MPRLYLDDHLLPTMPASAGFNQISPFVGAAFRPWGSLPSAVASLCGVVARWSCYRPDMKAKLR